MVFLLVLSQLQDYQIHTRLQLFLEIKINKWMLVMYWWARQYSVTDSHDKAEIDKPTAIDIHVYQWLRYISM